MTSFGWAAAFKSHHGGTEGTEENSEGPRASRPHAGRVDQDLGPAVQTDDLRDPMDPWRASVVKEAESWLGTPFHHAARVKGAGVDCLMLLAEVYQRAGVVAPVTPPFYVPDWHLHRDAERYLEGLTRYAGEIPGPPLPGDIALFRFGRTFSHGAIVTAWPILIHAYWNIGVVHGDATLYPLAGRPVKFFTPFTPG
jgi:NlpC/P60 family putative phage cell wall peptidase